MAPGEFHQTICMTKPIFEVCAVASFGWFNTVLDYDSSQCSFELQHIWIVVASKSLSDLVEEELNGILREFVCQDILEWPLFLGKKFNTESHH